MKYALCLHIGAFLAPIAAIALHGATAAASVEIKETAEEKKARIAQENLAKYDENRDGKLDRVETAVMRLDQARAAAAKAAAKKKAAEDKKAAAEAKKMSAAQRKKAQGAVPAPGKR